MIHGITLTFILAVIILLFFIVDFYFLSLYDPDREEAGKGWSWDYTLFTVALGSLVLLQPVMFPKLGLSSASPLGFAIQVIGGIVVLLSFGLHIWARQHLRHFYTERVEVQGGHQVINTGPYSLMRHPVFTSFFLLAGGIL